MEPEFQLTQHEKKIKLEQCNMDFMFLKKPFKMNVMQEICQLKDINIMYLVKLNTLN